MTRPLLIGVSARIHHPRGPVLDLGGVWAKTLHYLEQSVAHWVISRQVLPVMIPAVDRESMVRRSEVSLHGYAQMLDGLVLQGGNDIAPETYGESALDPAWAGDRVRDRYEIELLDAFIEAGKPVLGICRGCQLINVAFGGTLYQDIATQRPDAARHVDPDDVDHLVHAVELQPGTRLAGLYPGVTEAVINSIHHQAVKDLAPELVVEARSRPDGLVEALRWTGEGWVFGMQWHPEFLAGRALHDQQLDGHPILEDFLAAARVAREQAG
ncbi:MAG: gamma-glutamyl-gamma-aminobutyrate hydrolase family protein [Rubrivivax sp.]|jgi:putative glutamine amidotransferase|nr:gamma-glutamyl-gamma-aminobutyrate hydrolase family protein [Rubrivivax sp.]